MNPYLVTGLTLGILGGFGLIVGWSKKAKAAPAVTPNNLLTQILFAWKQGRLGNTDVAKRVLETAQQTALALGLTKTARAIKEGVPLPPDENWPGTNMSVNAYLKEADAKAQNPAS